MSIFILYFDFYKLLEKFNTLIDSFIENKIGISDDFISDSLAFNLKEHLLSLYQNNELKLAGVGNKDNLVENKLSRNDVIYWLDRVHNNEFENSFLDIIDQFVIHLNSTCFTNIKSYEFHYALYEKDSFYTKHVDQFKNNDGRKFSMIMYLNKDWVPSDGGELCIHHPDRLQNISPNNKKSVFFQSNELEHEVLITNVPRLSITGWLKN